MGVLGVWMWPSSVRIHGAEKVVSYCARAHITDIYFLTKGLSGETAYLSRLAPSCSERDLLGELLHAAHRRCIRVHAWLTSASDEAYKQLHPESGRCHFTRGRDKGLISLADEGYLAYMQRIIGELCAGYDIDGLHLDYIRYNHMLYGWDDADLSRYAAQGADIAHLRDLMERTFIREHREESCMLDALHAGDESVRAFARVRREDVRRFASAAAAAARAQRSCLSLSAALMPEGAYEDTAFADLHYGQSYEDAAALYDHVLPMAYANAYGKDSAWVRGVAQGTLRRGVKTVMGLHAYEGGTGPSLKADIAALTDTAVDGVCLFREGAFVMAFAGGRSLSIYNAAETPITRVAAISGDECISLACDALAPGKEAQFALPFEAETLRAFTGDTEVCAFLTR